MYKIKLSLLNLLGYIVHIVNSNPPLEMRWAFYTSKRRICQRFGERWLPDDIQYIIKHCWHCESWKRCDECEYLHTCCQCGGTHIYREYWVRLARYSIGRYLFHFPLGKMHQAPVDEPVTIRGLVKHQSEYPKHLIKHEFYLNLGAGRPTREIKYPLTWCLICLKKGQTIIGEWRRERQNKRLRQRMRKAGLSVEEEESFPF